jgi:type II secretory pathway pseudopilin PulG
MKIFDEIKINPQDFAGGGTGALVGLALGGLAGAAIGGALGSSRRSNKLSAQELAVMNAHQKTNTNRQDNKAAVISRIEKFHPTFIKMLNLPPLEKKSVTDLKNTNLDSDRIEPTMEQNVTEENQDDRNARIIAGEIEDAMSQGNKEVAQEKIKELIRVGYTLDKNGQLQRMGMYEEAEIQEEQDACYHKVKSRYKVWPSAYASGALVQCRKKGAANWGNKAKK